MDSTASHSELKKFMSVVQEFGHPHRKEDFGSRVQQIEKTFEIRAFTSWFSDREHLTICELLRDIAFCQNTRAQNTANLHNRRADIKVKQMKSVNFCRDGPTRNRFPMRLMQSSILDLRKVLQDIGKGTRMGGVLRPPPNGYYGFISFGPGFHSGL